MGRALTRARMRGMRVVLSGGPGSGKTSTIEALAARGHAIVPEAGIQCIAELNAELGLEGQREWRRAHRLEFQMRVLARQLANEARATAAPGAHLFLDRGVVDGLGYCRHFGERPPPELERAARAARYDRVFVLDTLPDFPERGSSGRSSGRADSLALRDRIEEAYRELGHRPTRVPVMSIEERADFVLAQLAAAPA